MRYSQIRPAQRATSDELRKTQRIPTYVLAILRERCEDDNDHERPTVRDVGVFARDEVMP